MADKIDLKKLTASGPIPVLLIVGFGMWFFTYSTPEYQIWSLIGIGIVLVTIAVTLLGYAKSKKLF